MGRWSTRHLRGPVAEWSSSGVATGRGSGAEHVFGGPCGTFSWVEARGKIRSISTATFIKFGELDNRLSGRVVGFVKRSAKPV